MYIRERGDREIHSLIGRRLWALQEASLRLACATPAEPDTVAALLGEIVDRAVASVSGRDGRLILAEDRAWHDLVPAQGDTADEVSFVRVNQCNYPRWPGDAEGQTRLDEVIRKGNNLFRLRWRPDPATLHVLETGESVVVADTLAPSRFGPYPQVAERGIGAFVLTPLQASGRVLGALNVSFDRTGTLSTEDQELLAVFAGHAAAALDRLRLLYAERRRANQMERLASILAEVGAAGREEQALETLLCGAIRLIDGESGTAHLFGSSTGEVRLTLHVGRKGTLTARDTKSTLPVESFAAQIQAGAQASLIDDLHHLPSLTIPSCDGARHGEMRAVVNVPVKAGGRPIGSLHIKHRVPRFFGPPDVALAEAAAAHAGAAIERARIEAERAVAVFQLAQQREELASRAAETAALQRLDLLKNELLGTISHELRTPLTIIHAYAQWLGKRSATLDAETVVSTAARIETSSKHLQRLVEQLLDFSRLERGEIALDVEDFDLVPVLQELLDTLRRQPGGEVLSWHLPAQMLVRADRNRLVQVVMNLVENAMKYGANSRVRLRCQHVRRTISNGSDRERRTFVRVGVEDEGPGIAADQQERIWEKFVRGGLSAQLHTVPGTGIGLAVVKALVEAQDGFVGVESTPGSGARFWFELPSPRSGHTRPHSPEQKSAVSHLGNRTTSATGIYS